jgi:hypothetical protein
MTAEELLAAASFLGVRVTADEYDETNACYVIEWRCESAKSAELLAWEAAFPAKATEVRMLLDALAPRFDVPDDGTGFWRAL